MQNSELQISDETSRLTPSQEKAFGYLQQTQNIFLTGAPGTGKSFLIRHYLQSCPAKIPVLASTGAAAILVGGRTFHSFFGLGIMQGGVQKTFEKAVKNRRLKTRLRKANMLIIDEVSMLSHEVLDCAEKIARALRACDEAWGGIRVIAVGDFAQLPPVSRSSEKEWAFLGEAWARSQFQFIELKEAKRSEDRDFLKLLEAARWGELTPELEGFLNARTIQLDSLDVPHIFPRRAQAEAFNLERLEELPGEGRSYPTRYRGEDRYLKILEKDAPIPPVLRLKEGALVMLRINDPKQRFVNGSLGKVLELREFEVLLEVEGRRVKLEPFCFSYQNADGEEVAFAENFPISLAYASTIHKTQGATVDRVHIDMKGLWEPGHAYVALSRARAKDGISLSRWTPDSLRADSLVRNFYRSAHSLY